MHTATTNGKAGTQYIACITVPSNGSPASIAGPDGKAWYDIQDEADKNLHYFVPAEQLRPISPAEITPLSPDVPMGQKRIDVNLTTQTLTCYE